MPPVGGAAAEVGVAGIALPDGALLGGLNVAAEVLPALAGAFADGVDPNFKAAFRGV